MKYKVGDKTQIHCVTQEWVDGNDSEVFVMDCFLDKEDAQSILVLYHKHFVMKSDVIDWLNKNHFDYRDLIPKDLAIDATGKNIY